MALIETVIFIVLIMLGMVLLVFGNSLKSLMQQHFGALENFSTFSQVVTELGFILATFIIFLFLYRFMPKHKVTFKSQIPGAIFGALALNIISFVFSKYLDIFKGFSITYGSLTTLMLIMMWTYSCFYALFLGAELNKTIEKLEKNQNNKNTRGKKMQKQDLDTVTNVILNNEYKLHEEQENKQINEENFKIDSKNKKIKGKHKKKKTIKQRIFKFIKIIIALFLLFAAGFINKLGLKAVIKCSVRKCLLQLTNHEDQGAMFHER